MAYRSHVLVCAGSACASAESKDVSKNIQSSLKDFGLDKEIKIVETGCLGSCDLGPVVIVYPDGIFYMHVKPSDAKEIVEEHLLKGRVVERLLVKERDTGEVTPKFDEVSFFHGQMRQALRNNGLIDPEKIEEYIARNGYLALGKVVTSMSKEQVIDVMKKSGLRGRGGGGFPTGLKWELAAKATGEEKFVVCNADEGDPGAFMDRSILEGNPNSVLEAMAIAGFVIGAKSGFIYVRAEYPLAVARLEIAIKQAQEYGLLGKGIFGTDFEFDIEIRLGAGAFVCGEETALIASVEGKRGEPRPKPPFPANEGLWSHPTLINNVETFANIPEIILNGADWYNKIGTEKSKGTKVFALTGKINNTGLVEVPMGTPLRKVIYEMGGGIPDGKKFKAAQTGGPSGGCIPAEKVDIALDFDSLLEIGSMMGSGGLIIMDEDTCMVDVARFYIDFNRDESCGRCTPCRIGTKRMLEILTSITKGKATMDDLARLEDLAKVMKQGSICGLGQTAPNPIISTLRYFKDEYIAHIRDKTCPAGVCKDLLHYHIDPEKCKKCGLCTKACGMNAITGERGKTAFSINNEICSKCGNCFRECKFAAIHKGKPVEHASVVSATSD